MSKFVRKLKDVAIENYFKFRIFFSKNPYRVLFKKNFYKIILILSHMRSGSSLLTHILCSNPEIIGYGETHIKYSSEQDFKKLIFKVYWKRRIYQMNHRYVLDKVLHNSKFLQEDFLRSQNLYAIFLLREPEYVLPSMIETKPHISETEALKSYTYRILMLENYARIINNRKRSFLLTYDQLINDSNSTFKDLKRFLNVKKDFLEEYEVFKTTGLRGIGDSVGYIKEGHIIRTPREINIQVRKELLEKGRICFNKCFSTLSNYCQTVTLPNKK